MLPHRKYGKLNHIVNNAGFTFDRMLHTTPDDAWDIIQKVHVRAPFRLIRAAAPYLRVKVSRTVLAWDYHVLMLCKHRAATRTARSPTSRRQLAYMAMSAKLTTQRRKRLSLASQRRSARSGVPSACAQTP